MLNSETIMAFANRRFKMFKTQADPSLDPNSIPDIESEEIKSLAFAVAACVTQELDEIKAEIRKG